MGRPAAGWPGPGTQVAAVIGSPIRHSLSPVIHNAAFAAAGLDWAFLGFDVGEGKAADVLAGAAALGIRGLSVTMPLKTEVVRLVERLTPQAARLGAVNTVTFDHDGVSTGDSHDGVGFVDALRASHDWEPSGRRVVVLGAGGAARAVVAALADGGAGEVIVVNRTPEAASRAAALAGEVGRRGQPSDIETADLVVNATSVGMDGTPQAGALPCAPELLGPDHLVVDLVYHPLETPLLRAARQRGADVADGVGMLVHQAARAFTGWTGVPAPLEAMDKAARSALTRP